MKPPVPKFRSDLSVRLRDIAEKQVPAKLKPIVAHSRDVPMLQHFNIKASPYLSGFDGTSCTCRIALCSESHCASFSSIGKSPLSYHLGNKRVKS